jgi:cytochrome P450
MFPPVWAMGREVITPIKLGKYELPKYSQVLIPIWVNQRRPDWYIEPEQFRPQRWLNGETSNLPSFGYFPFGGGVRRCMGERFAQQEIRLILAALLMKFRLQCQESAPSLVPTVTLRTREPIRLLVERR